MIPGVSWQKSRIRPHARIISEEPSHEEDGRERQAADRCPLCVFKKLYEIPRSGLDPKLAPSVTYMLADTSDICDKLFFARVEEAFSHALCRYFSRAAGGRDYER